MARVRYYINWLFRDLTTRRGNFVIAEVPNLPLIIFMISVVLSVAIYPGFVQKTFAVIAFVSLLYWGFQEFRGGRSRFRKLLGILGMIAAVGATLLGL
ncbi:MAG: hypothetical protein JWP13_237 [Candidatus Saccharibacteria bacterium]|nr:hypothetical protein [Candidatus Saccharibacteria bacterium]